MIRLMQLQELTHQIFDETLTQIDSSINVIMGAGGSKHTIIRDGEDDLEIDLKTYEKTCHIIDDASHEQQVQAIIDAFVEKAIELIPDYDEDIESPVIYFGPLDSRPTFDASCGCDIVLNVRMTFGVIIAKN